MARMRRKPADVVDHFAALEKRVSASENSRRIGYTSFDQGTFTSVGDLVEFRFLPPSYQRNVSGLSAILAFYYGDNNVGASLQLDNEFEDPSGNFLQEGGKLQLFTGGTILSHFQQYSGLEEAYIWLGPWGTETIEFRCMFPNLQSDGHQGIIGGSDSLGAGFSSYTYTYNTAFVTPAIAIVNLVNTAGLITSWNLTAQSTSSWTVTWSGTLAKTINFWIFRTE